MSYTHSATAFYDVNALEKIAINLFYGWGYNFYRIENQLRSDDLMIRSHLSTLLGISRKVVETQQSAYRRTKIPTPTREKPLPDPDAVAGAQQLEALSASIGQVEGAIRALPVPEDDRMTQRFRQERDTLVKLCTIDGRIVGQVELLRTMLHGKGYQWILDNETDVQDGLSAIRETIEERQLLLS